MQEIFISYRRGDSQDATGRVHDWLENYFGPDATFRDIDQIHGGSHFPNMLEQALDACKIVLVIIGPTWLAVADTAGQRRIMLENDWVRMEISRALARGIPIIPVLVTKSSMPRTSDLPPELAGLCALNAVHVEPGIHFRAGIGELVRQIATITGLKSDNYPAVIRDCRHLGLVAASLGVFSTEPAVIETIVSSRDLLIVMNDGRSFINALQERLRARNRDRSKTTRIVFLHPRSPFLDRLILKNGKEKSVQIGDIRRGFEALRATATRPSAIEIRGSFGYFPSSYVVGERDVFVSPYLCAERGSLPVFRFVRGAGEDDGLYRHLADDAEAVFQQAVPLVETDFA